MTQHDKLFALYAANIAAGIHEGSYWGSREQAMERIVVDEPDYVHTVSREIEP